MRLLILGGGGMLGHRLWLAARNRMETMVTARNVSPALSRLGADESNGWITGVDAGDFDSVTRAVATVRPDVVVNCIGLIKHRPTAQDPVQSLTVNALFPHRLAQLCRTVGTRMLHISTDCVFSGARGSYTEADVPDAQDLYGRSKLLGEVGGPGCLTLRTSLIGREVTSGHGLVEWFLAEPGPDVPGYTRAVFSGFTTHAFAEIVLDVAERHRELEGLYHVAAAPITKFDLLRLLASELGLRRNIVPIDEPVIDRSLDSTRFRAAIGFTPRSWPDMMAEMARDGQAYDSLEK